MKLSDQITSLSGVGPAWQKKLQRLEIKTIKDLLWHFPFRYDDYSKTTPIAQLKIDQSVVIKGEVISISKTRSPRRRITIIEAILEDQTGSIKLIWFLPVRMR